jgi:hypothetical protein
VLDRPRVLKRPHNGDGLPIGRTRNPNPVFDNQHKVEFYNRSVAVYTANIKAENLAAINNAEEQPNAWFRVLIDHRTVSNATSMSNMPYTDKRGVSKPRMTSDGWELYFQWTNGTTCSLPLRDIKDSNPIEAA